MFMIILIAVFSLGVLISGVVALRFTLKAKASIDNKQDSLYDQGGARTSWVIMSLFAVALAITVAFGSLYTQGEGVSTVQVGFGGNVVTTTTDAGLKVKAPWNSTQEFNIRNQTIEMYSNDDGDGKDGVAIAAPLEGGANATVSITITYSIDRTKVESIYKEFGSQEALSDSILKPTLRDITRKASAEYAPIAIKQERAALGSDIQQALEESWSPYGVTINQVNLGDISLDTNTEEAISQVITAQQKVEQSRAELEQAQITAEKTKTEAQAAADADQIIRCGATTTAETKMVNGKETQVKVVTPKTNEECEDRLNEQVLTTKYYDTLRELGSKGNMVVVIPPEGNAPIINLPTTEKE